MINVQAVETDGQFWVRLDMDGDEMKRHGPFANADEAEAAAARLAGICAALGPVAEHPKTTADQKHGGWR